MKTKRERRARSLRVRLTPLELAAIQARTGVRGLSAPAYVRRLVRQDFAFYLDKIQDSC